MAARFEYKFVRLDETTPSLFGLVQLPTYQNAQVYQQVVHDHAADGWRLVQLFAPPVAPPNGMAAYFELVFERNVAEAAPGTSSVDGGG